MTPRLLYVDTEDQYFLTHRLAPARAAAARGYEVHVATRFGEGREAIEAQGFVTHALSASRGGLSPTASLAAILELRSILSRVKPDLLHNIAIQNVILGSAAALGMRDIAIVNSLTGLGTLFIPRRIPASVQKAVTVALPWLLKRGDSQTVVQNPEDQAVVAGLGVPADRLNIVPGWGIDTTHYAPLPEPKPPITAAFAGRMLEDKGVLVLIEAFSRLRERGLALELLLAGDCDPLNLSSLQPEHLRRLAGEHGIEWLGRVPDIRDVWARAHFAIHPSRGGEGLPRSLLEAAACGRAMVATDVPGSRQIARDGQTALTVPIDDPDALAAAMARLASEPELRGRFAAEARDLVGREFSTTVICAQLVELYDSVLTAHENRAAKAPASSA